MDSKLTMPDEIYIVGRDKVWSELGDGELTGRISGCARNAADAEGKCETQDDWVVVIFPNSGRAMHKYYPKREDT